MKKFVAFSVVVVIIFAIVLIGGTERRVVEEDATWNGNNTVKITRVVKKINMRGETVASQESETIIYNVSLKRFLIGDYLL